MTTLAAAPGPGFTPSEVPSFDPTPPESFRDAVGIVGETLTAMLNGLLANVPFLIIALLILTVGVVGSRYATRAFASGMRRTRADEMVSVLGQRIVRIGLIVVALLVALSVAGISISAALATLGIAGLAVAFAMQTTLENFIAGVLLLLRKPFSIGDQIVTNEHEGTVKDINLRVTVLMTYDNEQVLVPNSHVLQNSIVNLTKIGNRRSHVAFGIDYRDDHNAVVDLVRDAVAAVDGVLDSPGPLVVCTGLGESSVDFDVLYWTKPHIGQVIRVRDRVVRATKDVLEDNGMTIPWPIRTLSVDRESADLVRRDG